MITPPKLHHALGHDRAFWRKFDNPPSMFTLWVALEDINVENGCLRMVASAPVDQYFDHEVVETRGGGTYALADQVQLSQAAEDVPMSAGQIVFFDSLQIHGAHPNRADRPRLALKLVFAERSSLTNRAPHFDLNDLGSATFFYKNAARSALSTARQSLAKRVKRLVTGIGGPAS